MVKIIDGLEFHIGKDGDRILLENLDLKHLKNIKKQINKRCETGVHVRTKSENGFDNVTYIQGKEVKTFYGYENYKQELKRR